MVPKASTPKLDFRIKLLAGNNVVMIESSGYESEIFMPQIINGRISFQNVIPNRRCCLYGANLNHPISKVGKVSRLHGIDSTTQTDRKPLLPTSNSRAWRMNAGTETRFASPLAYSTPAGTLVGKENYRSECRSNFSNSSTLPTPELARRIPTPHEVANESLFHIPSGSKVIRMYRNPTPNTPKRVGRVVGQKSIKSEQRTASIGNTSKMISCFTPFECGKYEDCSPDRPIPELRSGKNSTILHATQSALKKQVTPGTITKWRKCITPVRTYSRRQIKKLSSVGSVKKLHNTSAVRIRSKVSTTDRYGNVLPTYRVNPTQGTRSDLKVEVKKRKIVIDPKISITPRTFKRQQNDTTDLNRNSSYRLPRTRKQYEAVKPSAFDLLTSSNRSRSMSSKLNLQFRKGCVNKSSSTYPKYKLLCVLPPLEKKDGERGQTTQSEANNAKKQGDKNNTASTKHNS